LETPSLPPMWGGRGTGEEGGVHNHAGTMSPSDATDADAPADLLGERNTLRNLIEEVRRLLTDRNASNAGVQPALQALDQELTDGPLTHAGLESLRDRLGDIVGQAASGYFAEGDFIAWPRHRWADVGPHDWPPTIDRPFVTLSVSLARDAFGSASLLLTSTRRRPVRIEVSVTRPAHGPRITLRRGWHVSCPDRRYRADALILLTDGALTLAPGETAPLWIQLDSHGAEPGRFSIPLTLRSEATTVEVALEVEVFPVRLPETLDCALFNFAYVNEMALIRDLVPEALTDLRRHFINTCIIPDAIPKVEADREGNLVSPIDFSIVDRGVETYRQHARLLGFFWGADFHTSLGKRLFPDLEFLGSPWRRATTALYKAWIGHLKEIGLPPDRYFMYVYDENTRSEVAQVYALLKAAAPEVRLLANPTRGYTSDELKALAQHVDIWMPSYEALVKPHPEDFELLRATGRTLWIYSCINGTPMPLYDYYLRRHWVGWDLGLTGIAQWAYADHGGWNGTNSWKWVIGAFAVIYTQAHAPKGLQLGEPLAPSRRWEAWREGAQDFQLLSMARAAASSASGAQAETLRRGLEQAVSLVLDHPDDPSAADRARAGLLRLLSE